MGFCVEKCEGEIRIFLCFSRGMTDRLIYAEDALSIAYGCSCKVTVTLAELKTKTVKRIYSNISPVSKFMEVHSTVLEFSSAQTDRRSNKFNSHPLKKSQTIDVQQFFVYFYRISKYLLLKYLHYLRKNYIHSQPPI
jgi:hypothetical protein